MTVVPIRRGAGVALWLQIAERLRAEIVAKHELGDWLEPELALAERFGVHRHTLRHAVDALVEDGLIARHRGRGLQVVGAGIIYGIDAGTRFTERLARLGHDTESVVLGRRLAAAEAGVARRLAIAEGDGVAALDTLRIVGGHPFCLITHYLPQPYAEAVVDGYRSGSLHDFLAEAFAVNLDRTESLITTRLPDPDDARTLSMPKSQPVLRVKSVNVDRRTRRPVEYAITRFRGDRVQLSVDLSPASPDEAARAEGVRPRSQAPQQPQDPGEV